MLEKFRFFSTPIGRAHGLRRTISDIDLVSKSTAEMAPFELKVSFFLHSLALDVGASKVYIRYGCSLLKVRKDLTAGINLIIFHISTDRDLLIALLCFLLAKLKTERLLTTKQIV